MCSYSHTHLHTHTYTHRDSEMGIDKERTHMVTHANTHTQLVKHCMPPRAPGGSSQPVYAGITV